MNGKGTVAHTSLAPQRDCLVILASHPSGPGQKAPWRLVTLTHCQTGWEDLQKTVKKYGWKKSQKTPCIWTIKKQAQQTTPSVTHLIQTEISLERELVLKKAKDPKWTHKRKIDTGMLRVSMPCPNCLSAQNTM